MMTSAKQPFRRSFIMNKKLYCGKHWSGGRRASQTCSDAHVYMCWTLPKSSYFLVGRARWSGNEGPGHMTLDFPLLSHKMYVGGGRVSDPGGLEILRLVCSFMDSTSNSR